MTQMTHNNSMHHNTQGRILPRHSRSSKKSICAQAKLQCTHEACSGIRFQITLFDSSSKWYEITMTLKHDNNNK